MFAKDTLFFEILNFIEVRRFLIKLQSRQIRSKRSNQFKIELNPTTFTLGKPKKCYTITKEMFLTDVIIVRVKTENIPNISKFLNPIKGYYDLHSPRIVILYSIPDSMIIYLKLCPPEMRIQFLRLLITKMEMIMTPRDDTLLTILNGIRELFICGK